MIKRILPLFLVVTFLFCACTGKKDEEAVNRQPDYALPTYTANQIDFILNAHTTNAFTQEVVTLAQIENIIKAAVKSQIEKNSTPCHFTAITEEETMKQINPNTTKGCVIIVVSAPLSNTLDAGSATQSIYLSAQAMGLGANVSTKNLDIINSDIFKEALSIPSDYNAASIVCIGYADSNALTNSNSEIDINDYVNYIE